MTTREPALFAPETDIRLRSLGAYARGVAAIALRRPVRLCRSSFDRIARSDWSDLPEPHFLAVPSGRLGFRHYRAIDTRRVIVLIHGSACFGDLGHELAVRLVRRNAAHVYALDMRGHGLSQGPRGHAVAVPGQMVDDIATFLQHLHATFEAPQITLAGHSAGGGLVLALARSQADALVSSYLFLAPFLGLGSPTIRPHFGGWVRLRLARLALVTLANALGIRRFNETTVVDFDSATADDPRYVRSWSYNTLLGFGPGRWIANGRPVNSRKPVLVVSCRDDECFDPSRYAEAFRHLAPHAVLEEMPAGGHWDLLVDADIARTILRWLGPQPSTARDRTEVARTVHAA